VLETTALIEVFVKRFCHSIDSIKNLAIGHIDWMAMLCTVQPSNQFFSPPTGKDEKLYIAQFIHQRQHFFVRWVRGTGIGQKAVRLSSYNGEPGLKVIN
jgi:hypothetical protein